MGHPEAQTRRQYIKMQCRYWIITIALLLPGSSAHGEENEWWYGRNFKGWQIQSLEITGVDKRLASNLKEGLALDGKEAVLYEQILFDDVDRIILYLAKRGYPYAQVHLEIEPEGAQRAVILTLRIDTGPAVTIGSTTISGVPEGVFDRSVRNLPFKDGDVFLEASLLDYRIEILEALHDAGYARAEVLTTLEWTDTVTVGVKFETTPGVIYYFRRIEVTGVDDDLIDLAYTMVDIHPGEQYAPQLITDARNNLSRLGLFRQIRLDVSDVPSDSLDLTVVLDKGKARSVEVAAGWWSDERFSGRLGWRHRNLLRRGRGVSIELLATQFRREAVALLWWPAFFGAKRSMWTLRVGMNEENEDSYEKTAPGIGSTISYLITRNTGGTIGYFIERASYEIKTTEQPLFPDTEGIVGWWDGRLTRDATDDRVNPARGSFSWIRAQWGPIGGVSGIDWILGEISGTLHVPLRNRMVIAVNMRAGVGKPLGNSVVLLPDKRFYAGGSISHRGFNRRELGPKDENGLPLGGEVMTTGFLEWRFPFVWRLEGAVFCDWGQVWRFRDDVNLRRIEVAIGPAFRLKTPVGPFRLDWGWRITKYDTTVPRWALHFAIGYPM
ncbi:MAG: BamA/TamA family outer membrane protein [Gammaproteobacteria bacterium]|nr:BamA/TamA family outer membrane protein [Gammaproteobacteria bacterium]